MPYMLKLAEKDIFGKGRFTNEGGDTECVAFVRQATGLRPSPSWVAGQNVFDASSGAIPRGTAIATFDDKGRYPKDAKGKHAAIYLSHDKIGIRVFDQWAQQGEVKERTIYFNKPSQSRSNLGKTFYVIE